MSDWKNYLNENGHVFDDKEPAEGHFERFEERLNRLAAGKKRKQTLKIRLVAFSAAASVLLIIFAGMWFYPSSTAGEKLAEQGNEFSETEIFYKKQLDEQIAGILCKLDKADAETRIRLENDLQNIVEESDNFVKEIRNNENEELAIYYLVEHYKVNLETLHFINNKLENYFKC
jgi:hypothetical protein